MQDPNRPEDNVEGRIESMRMGGASGIMGGRTNLSGPEGYNPPSEPQYQDEYQGETYVVQDGDTLSTIASRFYGSAEEWERIYEANQDKLSNPDLIYPGQELSIPVQ